MNSLQPYQEKCNQTLNSPILPKHCFSLNCKKEECFNTDKKAQDLVNQNPIQNELSALEDLCVSIQKTPSLLLCSKEMNTSDYNSILDTTLRKISEAIEKKIFDFYSPKTRTTENILKLLASLDNCGLGFGRITKRWDLSSKLKKLQTECGIELYQSNLNKFVAFLQDPLSIKDTLLRDTLLKTLSSSPFSIFQNCHDYGIHEYKNKYGISEPLIKAFELFENSFWGRIVLGKDENMQTQFNKLKIYELVWEQLDSAEKKVFNDAHLISIGREKPLSILDYLSRLHQDHDFEETMEENPEISSMYEELVTLETNRSS